MKCIRASLLGLLCCVSWNLRGEDSLSFEANFTADAFNLREGSSHADPLSGEKSSLKFSFDEVTNPLELDPNQKSDSPVSTGALSTLDSLSSYSAGSPNSKNEEPSVFDSSLISRGKGAISVETTQELWDIQIEQATTNFNFTEAPRKENLTLFTEKKNEPLKINPLWQPEASPVKEETIDMPWGWSLGNQVSKEPVKKGFLDW